MVHIPFPDFTYKSPGVLLSFMDDYFDFLICFIRLEKVVRCSYCYYHISGAILLLMYKQDLVIFLDKFLLFRNMYIIE